MADEIIAHPTYMGHVRHFFDEIDLDHMNAQGVDLSTYALLSAHVGGRLRGRRGVGSRLQVASGVVYIALGLLAALGGPRPKRAAGSP